MREIKQTCYKGTRILLGDEKRDLINKMISILHSEQFMEISMPIIQHQDIFSNKVGEENNNMMFNFKDRGNRDLYLAPEYTAVVQKLVQTEFKQQKDVALFYVQECFRGERPQSGRYRQFTQLGVEILNPPHRKYSISLPKLACRLIELVTLKYELNFNVTRGLDYYKDGKGFEICIPEFGEQKRRLQLCGGGEYDGGVGFAIGIDRLILNT